ncbi:RNA-binding protein 41-like isoform X2 [Dysidea avara]
MLKGTPHRYTSRDVLRMVPNPKVSFKEQSSDSAGETIETEAQRQLRILLSKQLQPSVDISTIDKKIFTEASTHCAMGGQVTGAYSLEQYNMITSKHSHLEELRELGLTEDEIVLKLTEDGESIEDYGVPASKKGKYGADPIAHKQRMDHINEKIRQRKESRQQPVQYSGVKKMNRHELEIERSLLRHAQRSDDLSYLVVPGGSREDLAYPKSIMEEINMSDSSEEDILPEEHSLSTKMAATTSKGQTQVTCNVEPLPLQLIRRNKLSAEEIRAIPRFANYTPGDPSSTLYLKNLHHKVTEEDLMAVFGHYQTQSDGKLTFRLLTGRMKGQAFVKFPTVQLATEALQLIHGYVMRERPVIISYGHKGKT